MGKDVSPALQIALGLATGAVGGFAKAKRQKKEDAREDERFALEKELRQSQMATASVQAKIAQKAYDDSVAEGRVFTPEEKAEIEKSIAQLKERGTQADTETKEKDLSHYDEDRATKTGDDQLRRRYMESQIGAMDRSGHGGGGGGGAGGDDGMSTAAARQLTAMEHRMNVFKNAYQLENGDWIDEAHFRRYQQMADDYDSALGKWTGIENSAPPMAAPEMAPDKKSGLARLAGAPNPVQNIIDKPMAERSVGEQATRVFGGIGNALQGAANGVFRAVSPELAASYVNVATGEAIDPKDIPTEKLDAMVKAGIVRPMTAREVAGGVKNASNPDAALGK